MNRLALVVLCLAVLFLAACTPLDPPNPIPNASVCRDACYNQWVSNQSCSEWEWETNHWKQQMLEPIVQEQCSTWFINSTNETGRTCVNVSTNRQYFVNRSSCECFLTCPETVVQVSVRGVE